MENMELNNIDDSKVTTEEKTFIEVIAPEEKDPTPSCIVRNLRDEKGFCRYCEDGLSHSSGQKCDGCIRIKEYVHPRLIEQGLICAETKRNVKIVIVGPDDIDKLLNGSMALMVNGIGVVFDTTDIMGRK